MTMLRSIRERKGFTVSQLAARASIPTRLIADYEEGRQVMPLNHARLIAKALWVPIEELMPPAGSAPPQASAPATTYQPATREPAPPVRADTTQAYTPAPPVVPPPLEEAPTYRERERRQSRQDAPRPIRSGEGEDRAGRSSVKTASHPPGPISAGQLQELSRLAARLEIDQEQMEARIGKSLDALNRPEAKDWIKKLRAIADEIAPTQKVRFGVSNPEQEDREATYLHEQCDAQSYFTFKLFNGEQLAGVVSDFTPYTITVQQAEGGEIVLRKLAIAYYMRSIPGAQISKPNKASKASGAGGASKKGGTLRTNDAGGTQDVGISDNAVAVEALDETEAEVSGAKGHNHARDDRHQPLGSDAGSDRVGQPDKPERDQMDEDRGV